MRHGSNRGKGAALRTGLAMAQREGFEAAVTLDADGQHAASDAAKLAAWGDDASLATTLVLGYRDLPGAGAPPANRFSNWVSNFFLSRFTGMPLHDTQCGLRRYPLAPILALGAREDGYGWEAQVLIQAVRASVPISQVAVGVRYGEDHVTHFDNVRDPIKIIRAVLSSL